MNWKTRKIPTLCSNCDKEIKEGDLTWGNSNTTFCVECGSKYKQGTLVSNRKTHGYIDVKTKTICDFCKGFSIGNIHGKAVCVDHVGKAMEGQV